MTIISVSIPGSGHRILQRLLAAALGESYSYCEMYQASDCCGEFPCGRGVLIQKTHDFFMDLPISENQKYIIQYRDFFESAFSDYSFQREARLEMYREEYGNVIAEKISELNIGWYTFLVTRYSYWKSFVQKWLLPQPPEGACVVNYHEFVDDPRRIIGDVVRYIRGSPVTKCEVERAFEAEMVQPRSRLDEWPYRGQRLLNHLQSGLERDYELLNIPAPIPALGHPGEGHIAYSAHWHEIEELIDVVQSERSGKKTSSADR